MGCPPTKLTIGGRYSCAHFITWALVLRGDEYDVGIRQDPDASPLCQRLRALVAVSGRLEKPTNLQFTPLRLLQGQAQGAADQAQPDYCNPSHSGTPVISEKIRKAKGNIKRKPPMKMKSIRMIKPHRLRSILKCCIEEGKKANRMWEPSRGGIGIRLNIAKSMLIKAMLIRAM